MIEFSKLLDANEMSPDIKGLLPSIGMSLVGQQLQKSA